MMPQRTSLGGQQNSALDLMQQTNTPQTIDLLLTAEEAARLLRLHPVTVLRWARGGKIPCRKMGRKVLFPLSLLNSWVASGYTDSAVRAA